MDKHIRCQQIFRRCVAPAGVAVVIAACGGEKQMQGVRSPAAERAELVGKANLQPPSAPTTPTASTVVIAPEILRACNIPDTNAYFAFDSSKLTSFDSSTLDAVATCFTKGPMAGRALRLVGHADPRGSAEYNMTLGQSRADAVSGYLRAHGLVQNQVTTTSRGAMDATGRDETGWAHDRRVDVYIAE